MKTQFFKNGTSDYGDTTEAASSLLINKKYLIPQDFLESKFNLCLANVERCCVSVTLIQASFNGSRIGALRTYRLVLR